VACEVELHDGKERSRSEILDPTDAPGKNMTLQDLGIAISALGSVVLVGIQIVRFRIERSHVVVRLSVGEPDYEEPETARVSAAVFNRGRPAFEPTRI
jgi:hypothetical protein